MPGYGSIARILACPDCHGGLVESEGVLQCSSCAVTYGRPDRLPVDLRLRSPKYAAAGVIVGGDYVHEADWRHQLVALDPSRVRSEPLEVPEGAVTVCNGLTPELARYLPTPSGHGGFLVDIGCGSRSLQDLLEAATGLSYVGLDFSTPRAHVLGDAHAMPIADATVDVVTAFAVLEHLEFPQIAVNEVHRVLRPGGVFLGTVAFLEPFHLDSVYHPTLLGVLSLLRNGGFDVHVVSPKTEWTSLRALAQMELFGRVRAPLARAAVRPIELLDWLGRRTKTWRARGEQISADLDADYRCRITAGFDFVATTALTPRPGLRRPDAEPAAPR